MNLLVIILVTPVVFFVVLVRAFVLTMLTVLMLIVEMLGGLFRK